MLRDVPAEDILTQNPPSSNQLQLTKRATNLHYSPNANH